MTEFDRARALFAAALDAQSRKDFAGAEQHYREALQLAPDRPSILNNLAAVLLQQGRAAEALACCERLLAITPDEPSALNNLGNALAELGRHDEALAQFDRALQIAPDAADARSNRGAVLAELGRHDAALADSLRAAALAPGRADFQSRLAGALVRAQRPGDALAACDLALALDPDSADAWQNRGNALLLLGRHALALDAYAQAQRLAPEHPRPRWNEALCRLLLGDFEGGWRHYGRGWEIGQRGRRRREFTEPAWDGGDVDGTLLVWGEQGIGDQILFAGMLAELLPHTRHLMVAVDARLLPLLQRSLPAASVFDLETLPALSGFQVQVAMGDLGRFLRRRHDDFPLRQGYLKADPARARALRMRLQNGSALLCGLSWCSSNAAIGASKSMALAELAPLLQLPGLRGVNLQYGDTQAERAALRETRGLELAQLDDIDNFHDMDGLAALIEACDVVVSVSNTTVHLAGALGKPVLVMLPHTLGRIWYWHEGGDRSPWYPACRLLRQTQAGDWTPVIASAIAALEKQLNKIN